MKKKWTAILAAIAILAASATAYAEPVSAWQNSIQEPVWADTVKQTKTLGLTGTTLETGYPVLTVGSSENEVLQQALDQYSAQFRKNAEDFAADHEIQLYSQFRRTRTSAGGAYSLTTSSVVRSDEQILSILTRTEDYAYPAAHGSTRYNALNLDPATGEPFTLSDIVTAPDDLPGILAEAFARQYNPELLFSSVSEVTKDMLDTDTLCFIVGMEGVTFIYPEYSLWAYVYGSCFITLPYADYPQLFADRFTFAGDYITVLAPYRTHTFFEDGVYKQVCFSDRLGNEGQLSFRNSDGEWTTMDQVYFTSIDDAVYLVRTGGKYTVYIRTGYWAEEEGPASAFMAFTVDENDALQETAVSPEAAAAILSPPASEKIDLEMVLHPEHLAFERFVHSESYAIFPGENYDYDYRFFPEEASQKHAFIDLDGDGIDEMFMDIDFFSWPYRFFKYDIDCVEAIGTNGEEGVVTSSTPTGIYIDSDHRIIVHDHQHVGREFYIVCHLDESKRIGRLFTYSRIWENYDESQETCVCTCSGPEGDSEITLEEYTGAVEKLMDNVLELEFRE